MNTLKNVLKTIATYALVISLIYLLLIVGLKSVKVVIAPEASAHTLSTPNDRYIINGKVDKNAIISLIRYKAKEYGVDPQLAVCIASNESIGFKKEVLTGEQLGDGHLTCKNPDSPLYGKPIQSAGIYQWNLCAHPNVPFSDATDIEEATILAMGTMRTNPSAWLNSYTKCK